VVASLRPRSFDPDPVFFFAADHFFVHLVDGSGVGAAGEYFPSSGPTAVGRGRRGRARPRV